MVRMFQKNSMPITGWKWEIAKMFLYMAFPVAMFHYFNSPQIFEESITKVKRETYVARPKETENKIREILEESKRKRQLKALQELEVDLKSQAL